MSFHSTSSKGAAITRIGSFTGCLSAYKLSKVLSFGLQSIFSESWPFALRPSETMDYLKFRQVSLCIYGFDSLEGSKQTAGIRNLG